MLLLNAIGNLIYVEKQPRLFDISDPTLHVFWLADFNTSPVTI